MGWGSSHGHCTRGLTLALTALAAAGLGCVETYTLAPAPTATWAAGPGRAALTQQSGVTLVARAGVWRGNPRNLGHVVLPLWVEIDNRSGHAVAVRHSDFVLSAPGEWMLLPAIPPASIQGTVYYPAGPDASTFPYAACAAAARQRVDDLSPLAAPVASAYDPWNDGTSYVFCRVPLPTPDMQWQGLQEATVPDGQSVRGFLYFHKLPGEVSELSLHFEIVDAQSDEPLGEVAIPFVVEQDE